MPHLKAYDRKGNILAIGYNVELHEEVGSVIIPNLAPHTHYPKGEFFVSWEAERYETDKVEVPGFTTHESSFKEITFYFNDHILVKTKTAYDLAVDNGFEGTEKEWVDSIKGEKGERGLPGEQGKTFTYKDLTEEQLKELRGTPGEPGKDGNNGKSSYELAVEEGFQGELDEYLDSLHGEKGEPLRFTDLTDEQIQSLKGQDGTMTFEELTEEQKKSLKGDRGEKGDNGESAYGLAVENGFQGSITEFLESLKGEKGDTGLQGEKGIQGEQGKNGEDGLSAYEIAKKLGYDGTESEWVESQDTKINTVKKEAIEDPYYNEIVYNTYFDDNSKSIYHVVDIPHKDKDGNLIKLKTEKPTEPTTARELSNKHQHSVVINSSVFNTRTLVLSGVQIQDGEIIEDKRSGTLRTLGIKDDNTLVDFTSDVTAQEILDEGIKNTVTGFYPILNGEEKPYTTIENASSNVNEQHPRQIIAQRPNKDLMFITVEGRTTDSVGMTYDQMYDLCKELGASYAYCLDGGGSAQTVVRGNLLNRQSDNNGMSERVVPDFLFVTKDSDNKNSIVSQNYDTGNITKKLTEVMYTMSNINGIPSNLSTTSNLDTIDKTGFYWVNRYAIGAPGDMSHGVLHFQITANAATQIAFPYHESVGEIKYRRTIGTGTTNEWRAWRGNDTTIWNGLTLAEGWSNYGNGEPGVGYSQQGNKVYLKGTVKGSSSDNVVAVLPEELRPKITFVIPSTSREGDQYKASAIKINQLGEIQLLNPTTEWNIVSVTYLI